MILLILDTNLTTTARISQVQQRILRIKPSCEKIGFKVMSGSGEKNYFEFRKALDRERVNCFLDLY